MSKFGKHLIESAKEALAIARGEMKPARVTAVVRGYQVVLTPDDDTYLVRCPKLPMVITYGETIEAALHHAGDAIDVALASMTDDGGNDRERADQANRNLAERIGHCRHCRRLYSPDS